MKTLIATVVVSLVSLTSLWAATKDKSDQYKMGIYVLSTAVKDGTTTDYSRCNFNVAATCNWDFRVNGVILYTIKVDDGVWVLETYRQFFDSTSRQSGLGEQFHFKSEKPNPLDFMGKGDKVLFRVEYHKKLFGTEVDVFIPYASNTDKEAKFIGTFTPDIQAQRPAPPSDNVKAMCDNHKLSPELEKLYCAEPQEKISDSSGTRSSASVVPAASASLATPATPRLWYDILEKQELPAFVRKGGVMTMISSIPQASAVKVREIQIGTTPLMLGLVPGEKYTIVIVREGYKTITRDIIAGDVVVVQLEAEAK